MLPLKNIKYSYGGFYLQRLDESSVSSHYLAWLEDEEVTEFLQVRHQRYTLESLKDWVRGFLTTKNSELFGIYSEINGEHIGNASVYNVDVVNGTFDIGYFIGEKQYWGSNAGLSACVAMLELCFNEIGLRKIFTYVEKPNLRSRFVLQKIGFENEAVMKNKVLHKNEYVDVVIYGLDCVKWNEMIRKKYFS